MNVKVWIPTAETKLARCCRYHSQPEFEGWIQDFFLTTLCLFYALAYVEWKKKRTCQNTKCWTHLRQVITNTGVSMTFPCALNHSLIQESKRCVRMPAKILRIHGSCRWWVVPRATLVRLCVALLLGLSWGYCFVMLDAGRKEHLLRLRAQNCHISGIFDTASEDSEDSSDIELCKVSQEPRESDALWLGPAMSNGWNDGCWCCRTRKKVKKGQKWSKMVKRSERFP